MAANPIARLAVDLTLRSTAFQKGIKKSIFAINSLGSAIGRVGKGMAVFSAAAITGTVASLVVMGKAQAKQIDFLGKTSASLGISTEALSAYQLGTKITGTNIKVLNESFRRMVRRIGEAKLGFGEGTKGLKKLGLSADKLASADTEEAFLQIVDAISKLPTQAEKAGAAFTLFGRQGVEILNFLDLGREGIQKFRKENEFLGLSIGKLDVGKVEGMNDAWVRANGAISGFVRTMTVQFAPTFKKVLDLATALIVSTKTEFFRFFDIASKNMGIFSKNWRSQMIDSIIDFAAITDAVFSNLPKLFNLLLAKIKLFAFQAAFFLGAIPFAVGKAIRASFNNLASFAKETTTSILEKAVFTIKTLAQLAQKEITSLQAEKAIAAFSEQREKLASDRINKAFKNFQFDLENLFKKTPLLEGLEEEMKKLEGLVSDSLLKDFLITKKNILAFLGTIKKNLDIVREAGKNIIKPPRTPFIGLEVKIKRETLKPLIRGSIDFFRKVEGLDKKDKQLRLAEQNLKANRMTAQAVAEIARAEGNIALAEFRGFRAGASVVL